MDWPIEDILPFCPEYDPDAKVSLEEEEFFIHNTYIVEENGEYVLKIKEDISEEDKKRCEYIHDLLYIKGAMYNR